MAVYVDPLRNYQHKRKQYAHMIADTEEELHAFAESIDVKKHWFHNDHYDLRQADWEMAVARGAIVVTSRDLVLLKRK